MPDAPDGRPSHSRRRRRRYNADERILVDRLKAAEEGAFTGPAGESTEEKRQEKTRTPIEDRLPHPERLEETSSGRRRRRRRRRSSVDVEDEPLTAGVLIRRLLRYVRTAFRVVVFGYLALLGLVMLGMHQWGHENLTTAALMYLPPLIWIVPAAGLALIALFLDWKSLLALFGACVWFFLAHLDYKWEGGSTASSVAPSRPVRVLTWNRGQGKGASLQEIKLELQPDLILLQDSPGLAYYKNNPGYLEYSYLAGIGEFVLLSRFPILTTEAIGCLSEGSATPPAIKFRVLVHGAPCAVYAVHLPSPRDTLNSYKRGAFLWGILGFPGSPWESKKYIYSQFWNDHIAMARIIARRAREEAIPVIMAGDFNGPSYGPVYSMFTEFMHDSHREAGAGFGFTFPGETSNPLALAGPWLRLDQIFASPHWEVLESRPHPVPAQHLPVFAVLQLAGPRL